jgi:hypothetical protein
MWPTVISKNLADNVSDFDRHMFCFPPKSLESAQDTVLCRNKFSSMSSSYFGSSHLNRIDLSHNLMMQFSKKGTWHKIYISFLIML